MRRTASGVLGVLALLLASAVSAQDYRYHLYVDTDVSQATGCSETNAAGTIAGSELRLTANVTGTTVTSVTSAPCSAGVFTPESNIGGPHPVGLNIGENGADVIEFAVDRGLLGPNSVVRVALAGSNGSGTSTDVLPTLPGGAPILLQLVQVIIPTLGIFGLLLLVVAVVFVASRRLKLGMASLGALMMAGAVWAANHVVDGAIPDWSGVSALANDASGDATGSDPGADVIALFAEEEGGRVYFRIDAFDVENQVPVANAQAQTYLEDAAGQAITLTATDGDGDPLTYAIATNPTRGVLSGFNANTGAVTYTPNPNEFGADSFTFTANDGLATSAPATVSITLTPVNDVPGFTVGPNVTVLKDTGAQTINPWATAISAGPANESAQTLTFTITANDNPTMFSVAPAVSPTGVLTFTTASNANGTANLSVRVQDSGGLANGGVDSSATQNFSITLTPVNDAPSFTVGPNQTVLEDAAPQTVNPWATAISAGPPDESGQTLTFNVTNNTNAALFSAGPAISPAGVLTYALAANANGNATITLTLSDNGGTASGGVDTSAAQTFTITVTPVNDVPSFTAGANVTVLKDTGAQTINPWATALSTGPADESAQTLTFTITANDNPTMFAVAPSVSPSGVLTFTTAPNANGTANLSVRVQDSGGVLNGGVDTSATQNFSITLTPVNDAPSFTVGPNQTVLEDAAPQTVNPWATAISAGPADESGQTLTFNVTNNTNPTLFSAGPAVSSTGVLTYTLAANANGNATITLTLQDNGGVLNGGVDTSAPQNFSITVTPVNDVPSFTAQNPPAVNEDAGAQLATVATAISAGPPDESAQTLTFSITNNSNPTLFNGTPTINSAGQLSYTPAANAVGSAILTFRVQDSGGVLSGGVDTSATQTTTVTVNAVNDPPSFNVGPNQSVPEDSLAQTVNPWATAISPGPADEAGQTVVFNITGNTAPALFSAGPAVSPTGVLTYTPAANAVGVATISLTLQDNGGGTDTSAAQNFTITLTAVNDPPVNTLPAGPLSVAINTALALAGFSVVDIDAAPGNVQTVLTVPANSALSATASGAATVSGNNSTSLTVTGTPTDLNATLASLSFISTTGGLKTLSMNTSDQGNTGTGGVLTDGPDIVTINVDKAPEVSATVPSNGATGVAVASNLSVTFDEAVTLGATWIQVVCTGTGTRNVGDFVITDTDPTFTLNPTVDFASGESCTATINAAQVTDDDAIDGPDAMLANFVFSFATQDVAPRITSTTPIAAATVNQNQTLTLNFSESVNVAAGAISWNCPGAIAFTPALPQNGVASLVLTPTAPLAAGANCTISVESTLVTDADAVDPPNQLDGDSSGDIVDGDADDFALAFSVDAQPSVTAVVPADNTVSVLVGTNVDVTFSEAITPVGGWFQIVCPISGTRNTGNTVVSGGPTSFTINPNVDFSPGENCVLTVFAAQINDNDVIDPPQNLAADFISDFTTADLAPTRTTGTASGTIANNATITLNFSESVDIAAGGITWACAPGFTPALPQLGVTTITLTPTGTLPDGASCNVTLESTLITDTDLVDPPNQLDGDNSGDLVDGDADDQVIVYTVDGAPAFVSSVPTAGAVDVLPTANIAMVFSEAVNVTAASFTINCGAGNLAFTPSGSTTANITLDPTLTLPGGATCTVTGVPLQIDDTDTIDPPANPAPFNFSFTTASVAEDDAYPVNQHLTLSAPAAAELDANDQLGSGTITGFGTTIGTANGNAPGATLNDNANGALRLNANGTFTFFPPVAPLAATTDFFYTVTGGDTASITFTYQSELVWFVDDNAVGTTCTGDNAGAQACPMTTLTAAATAHSTNDTIFVFPGNQTATVTLRVGARLIGDGASGTLAAHSGVTPVLGSAFAAFGGTAPVITCGGNCVSLPAAGNNFLRGFTIGDSGTTGTDISGTGFGTLTVNEVTLGGNGRALSLTTGTLAGNFVDLDVTTSTNEGIQLNAVGGTWTVTNQLNFGNAGSSGVHGIDIRNAPASANMTFSAGVAIAKASAGNTLLLLNNAGGATLNLGVATLSNSNGFGISVDTSPVTFTGTTGTISAINGPAINANNATFTGGATFATVTCNPCGNEGINLNTVTGALTMNGGSLLGSATGSPFVVNGGSSNITYAGSISTSAATRLIDITARTGGTIALTGNLSATGTSTGINIANNTGGTINLSGATKTLNTGANAAVTLATNAGCSINFTGGGLGITTTSGAGFNATGGAAGISVQGAVNTIASTTGTALNVSGTTIAGTGLTFQSINSATASANQVISLANTGAGPVSVTGTGAAGTGGTIDNKTDDAIRLNNTGGLITLNQMIIEDIGNMAGASNTISTHDAIHGESVNAGLSMTGTTIRRISDQAIHGATLAGGAATVWNGLVLQGVTIEDSNRFHVANVGDANNEGSIRILGLRGTVTVNSSTFLRGGEFLDTFVTAGTLNMTVTNSSFTNAYKEFTVGALASVGGHCIDVVVQGAGAANVTIGNRAAGPNSNIFLNCRLASLRFVNDTAATGNSDFIVARNTFTVNDGSSGIGGDFDFPMGGVLAWNLGNGPGGSVVDTIIENNTFTDVTNASGGVGQLTLIAEGGLLQALVQNNSFVRPGNAPWLIQSRNTVNSNARVQFLNNTITGGPSLCTTDLSCAGGYSTPGLRTLFDSNTGATMDAVLTTNSFAGHDQGFDPGQTVEFRGLVPGGGTVCVDMASNQADDGYSLENFAGTMRTVGAGSCPVGSPSANCQTVMGNRNNRGGANSLLTNPPFVNVINAAVTVGAATCAIPVGGPF